MTVITLDTANTEYQAAQHKLEAMYLEIVMDKVKYNQSRAAKQMGLSRGTLRTKLREHFGTRYFRDAE